MQPGIPCSADAKSESPALSGAFCAVLRGILRGDAKRALDCAMPAPGFGHTHEEHAALGAQANEVMERHVRKKNGRACGTSVPHQAVALVVAQIARSIFSRYSSGRYLHSGVEEDCKGQTGRGRCHAFAKPFLQSLWSYPKQAGELFQAQVMRIQK